MKAVRFHEFGGPEKLRYEETPDPKIGPAEVLVKIRACALNHLDIWARGGTRSERIPLPHISGSDISGEITEVGDLVSGRSKGEKVPGTAYASFTRSSDTRLKAAMPSTLLSLQGIFFQFLTSLVSTKLLLFP